MAVFCTAEDVEKRLRRDLTDDEAQWLPGMIEEAQALVVSYLACPPDKYENEVPSAVVLVTSRMVARVIQEGDTVEPDMFGATQVGMTAGPYSQQTTFAAGARTGAPWLTKVDKSMLDPYRCAGKAFAIDTVPRRGTIHDLTCSAINYIGAPYWEAYCTCGAYLAGVPTPGVG